MTLQCSLVVVFHLLLGLLINVSYSTTSVPQEISNGGKVYGGDIRTTKTFRPWPCPDITNIPNISCTCDVSHTVRCRGQVTNSSALLKLSKELFKFSKTNQYVSLLDLTIHGLKTIPTSVFKGLILMGLVISNAGLRTLNNKPFGGLESDLAALGLPGNKFQVVPSAAIKGLFALRWLDLSDNELKKLTTFEFPNLMLLENLNLSGNNISSIETEAFGRLPQLKILNLACNNLDIYQLNEKTLWGIHSLRELSLKSNFLKGSLTPTFLSSLPSIVNLDLSHNLITKISINALSNSGDLVELDLSYNKIEIIEDHAFKCLLKLQKLELSHNNVVAISGWSFAHLKNLRSLSIADNSLFAVTADLLHQLDNLTSLDLASNDITLLQPNVLDYTQSLSDIDLSENPLHCDCSIIWLLNWIRNHENISKEAINSFVCTTPPKLENIALVEVPEQDLICAKTSDYYHDSGIEYDEGESPQISDAEISLHKATWAQNGIKLVWDIDRRAIPYTCQSMHIYEIKKVEGVMHQILTESMEINCTSGTNSLEQISVMIPNSLLESGNIYRYCLVLIQHGNFEDNDSFLPGCSEPILYSESPKRELNQIPLVNSLTVGVRKKDLIVQTRIDFEVIPCFYRIFVLSEHKIVNYTMLECPKNKFSFSSLVPGRYTVCAHTVNKNNAQLNSTIMGKYIQAQNLFSECTSVLLFTDTNKYTAQLVTLFFTLFGFAFFITAYVIVRKVRRGGAIPWKWDPRANKSAKYFLYIGETASPNLSMDNLHAYLPESTTRV